MMGSEMKPCPFCGSTDVSVILDRTAEYHMNGKDTPCSASKRVFAYCNYCEASGPIATVDTVYPEEDKAAAMEKWNRRDHDD